MMNGVNYFRLNRIHPYIEHYSCLLLIVNDSKSWSYQDLNRDKRLILGRGNLLRHGHCFLKAAGQ